MRNTTMIVLLLIVLNTPFSNLHAQTQITSCNTLFTDNGGDVSNYLNNENSEWLICPDDSTRFLSLSFTHVNIEAAVNDGLDSTGCYDILYIYDSMDASASLIGSFCGEESGTGKSSFIDGNILNVGDIFKSKNADGCFFLSFVSDQSKNLSGWEANVTCCTPTLGNGLTDGIDLFTEFEPTGEDCFTRGLSYENQSFYALTSNPSGGFIELEIDSLDSARTMEMIVFGPVILDTLGNYQGGYIIDCVAGIDPWSLFFNAGPNKTYILGVATENEGKTKVVTLPSTVGLGGVLPVKMIDYRICTKDQEVTLNWSTAQEINNDKFEIYRSLDGFNFVQISSVSGGKNSLKENAYSFTDRPNANGIICYFVRQFDLDGRQTDYSILKASLSKQATEFNTFPNPSSGGLFSLNIDREILKSDAQIQIYDHMGKLVVSRKLDKSTSLDFNDLSAGLYIIKIIDDTNIMTHQHVM